MNKRHIIALALPWTLMMAPSVFAQVPGLVNYQGRLTNNEGVPLDTVVELTFEIFEDEAGSTLIWSENHPEVLIINGLFTSILGEMTPFPDELWGGPVRFLGIRVGDGPLSSPLTPVVSVAYAIRAGSAAFADVAGFAEIAANVPEGAIRTEHIADGGVALIDLSPDEATPGQVIKFNGAVWEPGDDNVGGEASSWIKEGNHVYLAVETDSVGIGTAAPTAKLQVTGPILSGHNNAILDSTSCIGGGLFNSVDSTSVIGGGQVNAVNALYGTVGGGLQNQVFSAIGTVGGGQLNVVYSNGIEATIGGGGSNIATGPAATVAGGSLNVASGDYATVSGGHVDTASGNRSFVGGGYGNHASGGSSTVSGGQLNLALGDQSTVGGGESDTASGWRSTVGGGYLNRATDEGATIGGGIENWATNKWATVAGGNINSAEGEQASVLGGNGNLASGHGSAIAGGTFNTAEGYQSFVGGGYDNIASGDYSVVAGGGDEMAVQSDTANLASGDYSTVAGGRNNRATGLSSTVCGGSSNEASGQYSFAAGRRARALHDGSFIWADNSDTSFVTVQSNEFALNPTNGVRVHADNAEYGLKVESQGNGDGLRIYSNVSRDYSWASVYASNNGTSPAIYARSSAGLAGYFDGDIDVTGSIIKAGSEYRIDHPLNPADQYLSHSSVSSPDMMNVYNGNVTLDVNGEVWVELPDWFEALNSEYRYQLTAVGSPSPDLHIAEKISRNRFRIAGGIPGQEVSWQVTGVRRDPYANTHRIPVEPDKPQEERGKYLHPVELGMPASSGINYDDGKSTVVHSGKY